MTFMKPLPSGLYTAAACQQLDRMAIEELNIPGYTLMTRAGKAIFDLLQQEYSLMKRILVCCGAGNNAGDGYVLARLATKAGFHVDVLSLVDAEKLQGEAHQAWQDWHALGRQALHYKPGIVANYDVIIDALLGTGLQRPVEGKWLELVQEINQSHSPVIAVDIPSGLHADTGTVMGGAVKASYTLSFIGLKPGLFTHQGRDYCGQILFDDLQMPAEIYHQVP
ncbi:MAG: NAD(P)H-hydrate epimerase, partial [Gammaproteobacteria bacterium]